MDETNLKKKKKNERSTIIILYISMILIYKRKLLIFSFALCLVSWLSPHAKGRTITCVRIAPAISFSPFSRTMRIVQRIARSHAEEKASIINRLPALYRLFVGRSRSHHEKTCTVRIYTYIYTHTSSTSLANRSIVD